MSPVRRPPMSVYPYDVAPGRHAWAVLMEYPVTDTQAAAAVDGAELELDVEHPIGLVVTCHACELPYAFVAGRPCRGNPLNRADRRKSGLL